MEAFALLDLLNYNRGSWWYFKVASDIYNAPLEHLSQCNEINQAGLGNFSITLFNYHILPNTLKSAFFY